MEQSLTRCMRCEAPIPFLPGAGSRTCPFCGAVNLVREQLIAAPPIELKIDEVFRQYQNGHLQAALELANRLSDAITDNFRLSFYKASILLDLGRSEDAIYALIDLSGVEAAAPLRADAQAKLAEGLLQTSRIDEGIQAANRSLELLDGHPTGCLYLARGLLLTGELNEALKITQDTLGRLDRPWRITFPPKRHALLLLQAELHSRLENHAEAGSTLEDLLINDSEAPLAVVRHAVKLLSCNYQDHALSHTAALDLLRLGAMLDPENRAGLLDGLRAATERAGGSFSEELEAFKMAREELMAEIRSALAQSDAKQALKPAQISADLDLTLLGPDPDGRTDLLERSAERLQLAVFDRGTLYPLRTIEDFRRWVVAWRLRDRVIQLKQNKVDLHRILQLKQVRDQAKSTAPQRKARPRPSVRKGRSWLSWLLCMLGASVLFAGLFLYLAGERYLDQFQGNLVKVACVGEHDRPPCSLHVATGEKGRKRYRARHLKEGWLAKRLANWLDGHIQADGTLIYSLALPWTDMDPSDFRPCIGKPIAKMRFTLRPFCNLDD